MAFTEQEKARIRHHLGYPSWSNLAASIQLGFPAGSQPLFLVEQAFQRLLPDGETAVRTDLCNCESSEAQMASARGRLKATEVGGVKLNPREIPQLQQALDYWRTRLADDLGVARNPYSQAAYAGDPGGINSRIVEG